MKRIYVAAVAGLVAAAGVALWPMLKSEPVETPTVTEVETGGPDTSGIMEMTLGPADAKVTIIEYASFTCPHCANFHKGTFKQLKSDYIDTGKVQFIYRDVFFDQLGLWASMVARCDGDGKFFGISDMLYAQQRDWIGEGDPVQASDNLRRIGKVAGLSEEQVGACLENEDKARALVAWFRAHAEADDISSTPSLVINGDKQGNLSFAELKSIIDDKLAQ